MSLRILTTTALLLSMMVAPGVAVGTDAPGFMATMNANHSQFDSADVDSDGSQSIGYLQLGYGSDTWGINLIGSFARTDYRTLGGTERFSLTALNDTDLATYYRVDLSGITLRGGVDFRAPTGTSSLSQTQLGAMMADDLATDLLLLNSFGQGYEITPHLMAVGALTDRFTAGIGLNYAIKGEYDPSGDVENDTINPGDQLSLALNGVFAVTEEDFIIGGVTYTIAGRDQQNGVDVFRSGDSLSLDLRYLWTVNPLLRLTFGGVYQTQGKNERIIDEGVFSVEQANANNNAAEVYISGTWIALDGLTLNGIVGYKQVGSNGYVSDDPYYDAGREKWYVAPGAQYSIGESAYVSATFRYSRITDKTDGYSPVDAIYNVYNLDLSFTRRF